MLRRFSVNFAIVSIILDAGLTLLSLQLAVIIRPYLPQVPFLVPVNEITLHSIIYFIVPSVWIFSFLLVSLYDPQRNHRLINELQNVMFGTTIASLLFAGILYIGFREFSRWLFATFVLIDITFLFSWRILSHYLTKSFRYSRDKRRVVIIGAGEVGRNVASMISQHAWAGLEFLGYLDDDARKREVDHLPILGPITQVREIVSTSAVDDIIIALPQRAYGQINKLVLKVQDLPVHIRVIPDYFNLALYRASIDDFGGMPMISLRDPALNDVQRFTKRLFDLIVSTILLVITFPIYLAIALMIWLDSGKPILLRQNRVGENGQIFGMYKFRTMVPDADLEPEQSLVDGEEGLFKRADDPRITRFGHVLRRTSLDELPQLLNVLKGEMSLVGPRPELPWIADQYEPWQHKRLAVPQGMTGWWQVNGRANKPIHQKTQDDLFYVQNYSFWIDIYILLKTPWVVLTGKGAF